MRTVIGLILLICSIQYARAAVSCVATNYCMECHASTANYCLACFNWGSGSVGARQLASNTCTTAMANKITDCKYYTGYSTSTKSASDCLMCNKDYNNANYSTNVATCSNTAANTTTCTAKVSNCEQTLCYTADGTTYSLLCKVCKSEYAPSGTLTSGIGSTACATTSKITNCELHYLSGTTVACYTCKSNYAVASTSTTCSSYTTDSNCRQLNANSVCGHCWAAYYFNVSTCKLQASLAIVSSFILAIMIMFN